MASHVYHEIHLHLNWHTKHDHPILQDNTEALAHRAIRTKAESMRGVMLDELGGTDTHVHLAVRIEPQVAISELVQELKGASSFDVNKRSGHKALEWQRGYGVVSFGRRNLPWIADYIRRQRVHHASGRVHQRLEVTGDEAEDKPAEAGS